MTLPSFVLEQAKADFLDLLYERSGRTNGLYTGLWSAFCRESAEQVRLNYAAARHQAQLAAQGQVNLDPTAP